MNDDEFERILQDELEGVATPEDSRRLREHLARNAGARERRRDVEAVFEALARVPEEDAPADLKEGVMAAIAAGHEPAAAQSGQLEARKAALRGPHRLAWASPFLAGAVAGGLVIALVTGILGPRVRTDLPVTGTMLPRPEEGALIDRQELRLAGGGVTLETRRSAGLVRLAFAATASHPLDLTFTFDAGALRVEGFRWNRDGDHQAELAAGRIRLRLTGADRGVALLAAAAAGDAPVRVTIRSDEGTAQGTIHTAAVGPGR